MLDLGVVPLRGHGVILIFRFLLSTCSCRDGSVFGRILRKLPSPLLLLPPSGHGRRPAPISAVAVATDRRVSAA